jgi:hypothetical protein
MHPSSQRKTLACQLNLCVRYAVYNFITKVVENDSLSPTPAQETERTDVWRASGRSSSINGRELPVARTSLSRHQECDRFAPLFYAIFTFFCIKVVVYLLANLGASSTILILGMNVVSKFKLRFCSLQELLHPRISNSSKKHRNVLMSCSATLERIRHRTFQVVSNLVSLVLKLSL